MITLYIILLIALGVVNIISSTSDESFILGISTELISVVTSTIMLILVLFIPELQITSIKYQTVLYCFVITMFVLSWLILFNKINSKD